MRELASSLWMYLDLGFLPAGGFEITCPDTLGYVLPEVAGFPNVLLLDRLD